VDRDPTELATQPAPVATVEPPAPAEPPPGAPAEAGRRRWPLAVLAALVVLIALAGGAYALTQATKPSHVVPNVENGRVDDARVALRKLHFKVVERLDYFDNTFPGTVMKENPRAGTKLKEGRTVDLVVSRGPPPVTVPDL